MHPNKVNRHRLNQLTDLPNIGKSMAADLRSIGITKPKDLVGKDPFALYQKLCKQTGARQDPCVLDVYIAVTKFMQGEPAQVWWAYTDYRKQKYGGI